MKKIDIKKPFMVNLAKPKRELIGDLYLTLIGVTVGILTLQIGSWVRYLGFLIFIITLILLFTPEN